jgi:hypothetical protein
MDRSVSYSEFRIEIKLRLRFVSQPPPSDIWLFSSL